MYSADRACPRVVLICVALDAYGYHVCEAVEVEYVFAIPVNITYHLLLDFLADHGLPLVLLPLSFINLT